MSRKLICLISFVLVLVAVPLVTHAQVVNLLEDPSFENEIIIGNTAWDKWLTWAAGGAVNSTVEIDKTEFRDGEKSLRVNPSGTGQFVVIYAALPLEVGERYTVSFWAKAEAPRPVQARLQAMNNSSMETADFQLTTEWAEYTFTAEAANASIKVQIQWDASVEAPYWLDFVFLYKGEYVAGIEPSGWSRVKAADPDPVDGAADVPRDVVLSWTPGEFADKHDIYFGTSFDDVNDATDASTEFLGRQSETTYALDRLELDQTYYWRIDEVNAPPTSHVVFKGNVWSFTTEPIAYPIAGDNVAATASSSDSSSMGPENTVNGSGLDADDLHSVENNGMWLSSFTGAQPTWIQYEFDKVYKLHEMLVWNHNTAFEFMLGFGLKDVSIEYSTDGADWKTLGGVPEFTQAPGADGYADNTTVDFGGTTAKYVRLTVNSNWGGLFAQYGLSEVRFLYIPILAREPNPDSGARDVSIGTIDEPIDVTLGFRAGREAARHDVYFSSDEQAVIDGTAPVETVTETSYGPLPLDLSTTYYWRVDEVNDAKTPTTWKGDLWDFRTQEYFVVDDFEDYNDYPPDEIFSTWIDGWEVPENGSLAGHADPPFAETGNVHGGGQSMPLYYDNNFMYSEATMTLVSARDWTQEGVGVLSLWFYGDASNIAERMYVALNGSAVVYHDNPNAAQVDTWTQWNIDLQGFADQGVNLANVNTIAIGFGDKNNPLAGGSGMMYFDDIRLYRPAP